MNKIIVNKIKCKKCGDTIESTYRHDFKFCKCGAVAVDGGKDYLRRLGYEEDYEELSEVKKMNDKYVFETESSRDSEKEYIFFAIKIDIIIT